MLSNDRFTLYESLYVREFLMTFAVNFGLTAIHAALH
ncbi:Uncharacterised protein [Mycobacteroides abscessus subsp. abscessus]|nr:Uncharacterised protein [Mycobacteroides abscessus subsp. abscessus]